VQWAASVAQYEAGDAVVITAYLLPASGPDAPAVEPTAANLQTDRGPLRLSVVGIFGGDLWGATRLEMGLPVLKAGAYRAEFLDLADASGTWRFRVGDFVIRVLPGAAPGDLVLDGGDGEVGQAEGGSVTGFRLDLHNTTSKPIEVTGATSDIPGLPLDWLLAEGSPPETVKIVKRVAIPAGGLVRLQIGTMSTAHPVSFVLVSPVIAYRVGGSADRRAVYDPVLFESGFGELADVLAYRDTLPGDACARRQP
jgi:hypothetical protein